MKLQYWCNTDEEKSEIKEMLKQNTVRHEEEKRDMINYDNFVKGNDIPIIRRLDYVVEGINNMESGYLCAALRKWP